MADILLRMFELDRKRWIEKVWKETVSDGIQAENGPPASNLKLLSTHLPLD